MKPGNVFQRYDIRGKHPEEIDGEFAEKLGKAYAEFLKEKGERTVVVGKDTKDSSGELKEELVDSLSSHGIKVLDAGTGPTDYVAFAGSERNVFSVQVTSSHLEIDTNGFKFMYPEGNGLLNEDLDRIKSRFSGNASQERAGVTDVSEHFQELYLETAESFVRRKAGEIRGEVTVETMGGAGSVFLPELLERLGAEVEHLDTDLNPPEPSPSRLQHIEAGRAVATDMDADRVAYRDTSQVFEQEMDGVIDGWIDGNRIFAALARELSTSRIVASIDTSPMLERSCDAEVEFTRVGDPFVTSRMLEIDAGFSGEPNNHYCFPEFVAYNSGTLAAALLLAFNPDFTTLPQVYTTTASFEVEDKEASLERLKASIPPGVEIVSDIDGVLFRRENGDTVLARSSGTEPKIRVVAHSSSSSGAASSADMAGHWLQKE